MLPPWTHTADARTAGWRKVPRRILPRTSSVWRQLRRPLSRSPIPQRRMNVEVSGGTRFHPRPRFFTPRPSSLSSAARHVTGYPARLLREWIRVRVEPRPPRLLARESPRSVLDCGGAAERSHRFGRCARSGEAQPRSSPGPAGEGGGKPHALQDLAESTSGGRRRDSGVRGAPRRLSFASRERVSVRIGPHRYAAPIRLRCRRTLGSP